MTEKEIIEDPNPPDIIILTVKSWRNTDKYYCPKCKKVLTMPTYTCTDCNIKIQLIIKFNT